MIILIKETLLYVINTLINDSIPLGFGIIVACILNVYIDAEKLKEVLIKSKKVSILGSVAFGAFTPLCACGTMAVIVSMLTTVLPWGPIMAFITSSPLMSPDLFVMLSGIISVKFAVVLTISSILIGTVAGFLSYYLEKHTHFFDNQTRLSNSETVAKNSEISTCNCSTKSKIPACNCTTDLKELTCNCTTDSKEPSCNCSSKSEALVSKEVCCSKSIEHNKTDNTMKTSFIKKYKLDEFFSVLINLGFKKVVVYFSVFAAIGYLINRFVPASVIISLFGADSMFSVPLAAIIGIPLYVSDASSIPLLRTLMDAGASGGAVLAFMITGPGTSIGAIVGSLTIMKRKAVLFYVSIIFVSSIILGYLYNFLLVMGL